MFPVHIKDSQGWGRCQSFHCWRTTHSTFRISWRQFKCAFGLYNDFRWPSKRHLSVLSLPEKTDAISATSLEWKAWLTSTGPEPRTLIRVRVKLEVQGTNGGGGEGGTYCSALRETVRTVLALLEDYLVIYQFFVSLNKLFFLRLVRLRQCGSRSCLCRRRHVTNI